MAVREEQLCHGKGSVCIWVQGTPGRGPTTTWASPHLLHLPFKRQGAGFLSFGFPSQNADETTKPTSQCQPHVGLVGHVTEPASAVGSGRPFFLFLVVCFFFNSRKFIGVTLVQKKHGLPHEFACHPCVGPCKSSLYRSDFSLCAAQASTAARLRLSPK